MYLKKLQYLGQDIKELVSQYLGKKYNENANITYCKLTQTPGQKDFKYTYTHIDRELDELVSIPHTFTDFNHIINSTIGEKDNLTFDNDWIKIVYKSLAQLDKGLANSYIESAQIVAQDYQASQTQAIEDTYINDCLKIEEKRFNSFKTLNDNLQSFVDMKNTLQGLNPDNDSCK